MYVNVTTEHGDKMHGILKTIDANEVRVVAASQVPDGVSSYCLRPFIVPPECSKDAIAACSM